MRPGSCYLLVVDERGNEEPFIDPTRNDDEIPLVLGRRRRGTRWSGQDKTHHRDRRCVPGIAGSLQAMEQDVNLGGGPWILLPLAACSILLATLGALALCEEPFSLAQFHSQVEAPQPNSIATMKYLFSAVVVAAALVGQTSSADSAIRGADSNGGDLVSFAVVPFVLFSSFMIFINHLRNWRRSMRREVGRTT